MKVKNEYKFSYALEPNSFRIFAQPEELRGCSNFDEKHIHSSHTYDIDSFDEPEIRRSNQTIYLRGNYKPADDFNGLCDRPPLNDKDFFNIGECLKEFQKMIEMDMVKV